MSFRGRVASGPDTEAQEGAPCFLVVFLGWFPSACPVQKGLLGLGKACAPQQATGGGRVGWNTGRCPRDLPGCALTRRLRAPLPLTPGDVPGALRLAPACSWTGRAVRRWLCKENSLFI